MNKIIHIGSLIIGAVIVGWAEHANKKEPIFEGNGIVSDKFGPFKDKLKRPVYH